VPGAQSRRGIFRLCSSRRISGGSVAVTCKSKRLLPDTPVKTLSR